MADIIHRRAFLRRCAVGGCGALYSISFGNAASLLLKSDEPGKWSKEAWFTIPVDGGIQCQKCPHGCILTDGDTGICKSRVNYKGKVYSIAYGNPCAVHIDPIEKKPFNHFLPTTTAFSIAVAGCTLACLNCQNWQISQFSPNVTENYDLMPEKVVEQAAANKCKSIAYTYSEPTTFYEYAFDTATLARRRGIRNVWKSNGFINEAPLRKLCTVLDAANIDLKSYDDAIYKKLNAGRLEPVLRSLKIFHEEGVWLEITNLVIPGWTDNLKMIEEMCKWIVKNNLSDCPLHFSRFTPLYKLNQLPTTPVKTLEKAREIALNTGIKYVYVGNVPAHPAENTFCHNCKKLIIERRGYRIAAFSIVSGKCAFCGTKIPGVWG
jgi:pyruvate formate lyase activating enzyme